MSPVYPTEAFSAGIVAGMWGTIILREFFNWLHRKFVTRREALEEVVSILRRVGTQSHVIERLHKALR